MKYIKLFENKILDDILDKISEKGKESLTKLELDYLKSMESDKEGKVLRPGETDKIQQKMERESDLKSVSKYDPRKDNDFYKTKGMNFDNWSDQDVEDGKLNILWDKLNAEEMDNFIKSYELDDDIKDLTWDKLSDDIQEYFQVFLYENDLLKTKEQEEIEISSAWDLLNDEEIHKFLEIHQLPYSFLNKPWEQLPNEIKNLFMKYAQKLNLI